MTYNEIEKEATEWYNSQPMGSAVRQNGPAAIEAYIAATKKNQEDFTSCETALDRMNALWKEALVEIAELKAKKIKEPKKQFQEQYKNSGSFHPDMISTQSTALDAI